MDQRLDSWLECQGGMVGSVTMQGAGWTRGKVLVGGDLSSPDMSRLAPGPIQLPLQWAQGRVLIQGWP
jgi:hypothetical protein